MTLGAGVGTGVAARPVAVGILDAAEQCFERRGVRRTTIEDVAAEAGVSRVTVYRQVGNRDELVRAVLLRVTDRFIERALPKVVAAAGDLTEGVRELMVATVMAARRDNSLSLLFAAEEAGATGRPIPGATEPLIERFGAAVGHLDRHLPGRLRPDVTTDDAGEWVTRVVVSLLTVERAQPRDEPSLRRWVARFAVNALVA